MRNGIRRTRGGGPRRAGFAAAVLAALAGAHGAAAQEHCPMERPDEPVPITAERIGPLPMLGATIAELRGICPAAYVDSLKTGHGDPYPVLVFPFPELEVVTGKARVGIGDFTDPETEVHGWIVRGTNAVLPGGVSLGASWSEFERAYGQARGIHSAGRIFVDFCALAGFTFAFDSRGWPPRGAGIIAEGRRDIRSIVGPHATIEHLVTELPQTARPILEFCESHGKPYGWMEATGG